ncbi:MAG: 16S rRNA (guanine(527)-N(7))-methyltransferase RsmG [Gammaproteobacteria bacterium]|nr:16S rRNA (guanine(527)-N(7))-methyltransferase RsmG [Gammaproteobacteria bacterium]
MNIEQGLASLQFELPGNLEGRLLDYLALLVKWNRVYNLSGVREAEEMIPRHLLDSLAVLPYVRGPRILDVGTGAGLPGLPLALARPDWHWVLLDSNAKKTRFVTQAVLELGMENVEVVRNRVESFHPHALFACIVSRAYAGLQRFYTQTARLCAPQGRILAMKGKLPKTEIMEMHALPAILETAALQVPGLDAERHVVIIEKSE